MQKLYLTNRSKGSPKILCLGAHGDDIEIGCGGTVLRLLSERPDTEVQWVVFASKGRRKAEALASAKKFLAAAKKQSIVIEDFRDGFFPFRGGRIKEYFEKLKRRSHPDLIFTHCRHDLHQDHRLISELTWNTFRDHLILEYEIIKYDGDLGSPNLFVHLSRATCDRKINHILSSYPSQGRKDWFDRDVFLSTLRIRGVESRAPQKYAEAFYARKMAI